MSIDRARTSSEGDRLGALLVQAGLLSADQLDRALSEQAKTQKSLGRILIDGGLVTEGDLVAMLSRQIGLDFIDLSEHPVDPSAAGLITSSLARRYEALSLIHI